MTPFAYIAYRRLFAAEIVSILGTGLSTVALSLLAWDLVRDDAGTALGAALALKMIAYVVVAPLAGAAARRLSPRGWLIALDLVRAALVFGFVFAQALWQVYLTFFLLSACTASFRPIYQALLPQAVPDERAYGRALAYSKMAYDLENILSPTLAGIVLSVMSFRALFALDAVTYAVSALFLAAAVLPAVARPSEAPRRFWADTGAGIAGFFRRPRLRAVMAFDGAFAAVGAMVLVNSVVYAHEALDGGEIELTRLLLAFGLGSVAAALAVPRLLDRLGDKPPMLAGVALLTLGAALAATLPGYAGALAVWATIGFGAGLTSTPVPRLIRASCAPAELPVYFAAHFSLSHGAWLVAYPLAGWLGEAVGLAGAFATAAAAAAACGLAALLLQRGAPVRPVGDEAA